jgi:SRSO17 transposase
MSVQQRTAAGCALQAQDIAAWQASLAALHAQIGRHFHRAEVRARVGHYLAALLAPVARKNGWQLAEQIGESGPQGVQRLLNAAEWSADAVRDDLQAYVSTHLGEPSAVLVVDETGFLKKGTKSVGVARQYSGTAGRIENCQVGVFLAYASAQGHTFLDRELYLPHEWTDDALRCQEAGVPKATRFATKPQLARQMLQRAFAAAVPSGWVTGDAVYGDDGDLRRWLEEGAHPYVLAVSCTHPIWQGGEQRRADELISALPATAWGRISAGRGSQGERLYDWACVQLPYSTVPGMHQWLLARRSLRDPQEIAYYRAFGPERTPLSELVRVAGARWAIECCFEEAKGRVGLDEYEVRGWTAWYRHITLALLAHAYLVVTRQGQTSSRDEAVVEPEGGRKGGPLARQS